MVTATGLPKEAFCMACYDGQYPVAFDPALNKHVIERRNGRVMGITEALAKERDQFRLL
jgi:amidophosphoribosyltransferase